MPYEKDIVDTFGDNAKVSVGIDSADDCVLVELYEDPEHQMIYTPAQARSLARALKRAANVAEGKPAKTTKKTPREIVDGEGDRWELNDNGTYDYEFSDGNTHYEDRSRGSIRRQFGIREERA